MTIEKALKVNPELRKMCEDDEEVKYLIEMAKRLEGLPRHSSMPVSYTHLFGSGKYREYGTRPGDS